jgi:hypothetical protein
MMRQLRTILTGLVVALALACSGDGDSSSPSTPSVTIGAPGIVSPNGGAQVAGQATLIVTNATVSSGTASYTFQISTDSAFGSIVAQTSNIPQGTGQTSWTAGSEFGSGEFFWQARASVGATQGPFSAVGNFQFQGGISTSGGTDTILMADSLLTGTSLGDVGGGIFTSEGWQVEASSNFIVYDMQTIETGFLEFDVKGLDIRNPSRDARHLFFMWDPSLGSDMTSNRFRVSLQKLDGRSSINDRWLRLRFISQGRQIDVGHPFRGWTPEQTYRIRLEWGREGDVNACRLFIEDGQIFFFQYPRTYNPQIHRIELGAAGRAESPEGAIYSNIAIGTR